MRSRPAPRSCADAQDDNRDRLRPGFGQRRRGIGAFALLALFFLAAPALAAGPVVDSAGFTVSDLDRSVAFFTEVLDFEKVSQQELWGDEIEHLTGVFGARVRVARLALGSEAIELSEYLTPRGRPVPADAKSYDRWFQHVAIVVSDIDAAYARLRAHGVRHVSTAPQRLPDWNPAAGGISAFYFQDEDGHNLEIISYPPGKGQPRWQAKDRLFLGLDHTAIVVDETGPGLAFWRDLLGFRVAGESHNWGTEQEHLNQVFGARLHISGLAGGGGPAVEFLDYLAPSNGRPLPQDAAANDLVHWQTTLVVEDLNGLAARLQASGVRQVSSGVVSFPGRQLGFARALLVRDPDGHAVRLIER